MAEWDEIKPGHRIEMLVSLDGAPRQFSSAVAENTGDSLIVRMPRSAEAENFLAAGQLIEATVHGEENLYKFKTRIKDRKMTAEMILELFRPGPGGVAKTKPRSFFRLDVSLPAQYRLMRDEVTPVSEFKNGSILDISGGGLMFEPKKPIEKGGLVEISVALPGENDPVTALIKIGFTKMEQRGGGEIQLAGGEFAIIGENDRDKIVKFIFTKQRELVKKGIMR